MKPTQQFRFFKKFEYNEVIKSHLIVFKQEDYDGSQGDSIGRAADKVSATTENYCYE